jgi:hypothetical protein
MYDALNSHAHHISNRKFNYKISKSYKIWPSVFLIIPTADVEYLVISSLSCSEEKGSTPFFGLCLYT